MTAHVLISGMLFRAPEHARIVWAVMARGEAYRAKEIVGQRPEVAANPARLRG